MIALFLDRFDCCWLFDGVFVGCFGFVVAIYCFDCVDCLFCLVICWWFVCLDFVCYLFMWC